MAHTSYEEGPLTPHQLRLFCRRYIRKILGIKYEDAVKQVPMTPNCLSMALNSSGRTRIGTVVNVLEALGCEVDTVYRVRWKEKEPARPSIYLT